MVEDKLAEIREKKIYEMKRMFAAKMYEGVGGLTKAEVEARKKAGYRKASEVLGDPREKITSIEGHKFKRIKKKVVEGNLSEIRLSGETSGSEDRKETAGRLRQARKIFKGSEFRKEYLKTRMQQKRSQSSEPASDHKDTKNTDFPSMPDMSKEKRIGSEPAKAKKEKKKSRKAEPATQPASAAPSTPTTPTYKRPGMLKRNINTLMGREPGHVDERTPEEKLKQKGGRGGKIVRKVGTGLGRALGSITSDLADIGTRHL